MEFTFSLVILNLLKCEAALRILGGRDALKDEFPFVVRLDAQVIMDHEQSIVEYYQICSGAALTSKWILTAAHCYFDDLSMFARYNSYFPDDMGKLSPILKTYIHPQYTTRRIGSNQNDVALFQSQNILVSQYGKISAVDYKTLIGHKVMILGFGGTNATATEKPLQVLDGMMNDCLEDEKDFEDVPATMMCVVPPCGLEATICGGDSGGPVVHSSGIVGVNSMSADDCNEFTTNFKKTPGSSVSMVAVISHEIDWFANVISKEGSDRTK
ncbi:serine protease 1-like [Vanessa cardui]|uniref:serine protease 1-like n=1 Tax=Vanessa cardui TaxID=171605 RepID=UPI001F131086|nr:serine protease 1-like [Vanessa cardui]